jgi:hypothetical protein
MIDLRRKASFELRWLCGLLIHDRPLHEKLRVVGEIGKCLAWTITAFIRQLYNRNFGGLEHYPVVQVHHCHDFAIAAVRLVDAYWCENHNTIVYCNPNCSPENETEITATDALNHLTIVGFSPSLKSTQAMKTLPRSIEISSSILLKRSLDELP